MNYSDLLDELKTDLYRLQQELTAAAVINANALQMDMVRVSSLYMKWAFVGQLADQAVRQQKRVVEEEILPAARNDAETICKEQKRKVLKQTLDDIAFVDPGYVTAVDALEKLKTVANILKEAKVAILTKRDMLQSLNSRQKVELEALPEDTAVRLPYDDPDNGEEAFLRPLVIDRIHSAIAVSDAIKTNYDNPEHVEEVIQAFISKATKESKNRGS